MLQDPWSSGLIAGSYWHGQMGTAEHCPRGGVKTENLLESWEDICPGQPEVTQLQGKYELDPRGESQSQLWFESQDKQKENNKHKV